MRPTDSFQRIGVETALLCMIPLLLLWCLTPVCPATADQALQAAVRDRFALGVCAYWEHLTGAADKLREDQWQFIAKACDDMKEHGVNTVFLGNAPEGQDLDRFLKLCAERGLGCIPQTSAMYYRFSLKPEERRAYYEKVTIPNMKRILPAYKNRPGLLAWSFVEETPVEVQAEIAEQRKVAFSLDPTHTVVKCYNSVDSVKAMQSPCVPVVLYDTYRFTFSAPGDKGPGVLLTPKWAAESTQEALAAMYEACRAKGAVLWFVAQSATEFRADKPWETVPRNLKEYREKLGAVYWDANPSWHGWTYYRPPLNAIFLQAWQGVSEGATGILFFAYNSMHAPPEFVPGHFPGSTGFVNLDLSETPSWFEFSKMAGELGRYSKLIPVLRKVRDVVATADNPEVVCRTFRREGVEGDFLVVVNRRIGTWPGQVSSTTDPKVLRINDYGDLEGITPAGPLSFSLTVRKSGTEVFDLESAGKLSPVASGKFSATLGPGRGRLYFVGDAKTFDKWVRPRLVLTEQ